ncbi:hypothetical protein RHSIM_Rhsim02G0115200 [Rhododendron simsii]|uniref:Uncharacterized protein n=1 Tax=Rhododendron simsii TaxID=118357 RepID=A0A834LTA1_RHOSS|nr:hypothetical protein RHSIM_Rhsim02G0115200 [Rhododendron simsii]
MGFDFGSRLGIGFGVRSGRGSASCPSDDDELMLSRGRRKEVNGSVRKSGSRIGVRKGGGNSEVERMGVDAGGVGGEVEEVEGGGDEAVLEEGGFDLRASESGARSDEVIRGLKGYSVEVERSRRAVLGLVAAGLASRTLVKSVLPEAKPIKIGPPLPPSGGLLKNLLISIKKTTVVYRINLGVVDYIVLEKLCPNFGKLAAGTLNSDDARDLDLPLKGRFFLQPLPPAATAKRAKESAKEIVGHHTLGMTSIVNTIISSKPKEEKKPLKELTGKLFRDINKLDYAAKIKSTPEAEKYYAEAVSTPNDVLAKIG